MSHKDLQCPECSKPMELRFGPFRYKNGDLRPYYRCLDWPTCRGSHGAHPNGAPLGFPANAETKKLRMETHDLLDQVFGTRSHKPNRKKQQTFLKECGTTGHVSQMDDVQCRKVIQILKSKL